MKLPVAVLVISLASAGSLLGSSSALANQDGKVVTTPYNCESNVYSSLGKICDLFKSALGISVCATTVNSCVSGSQEMFNGLNIELASPTNIKAWTGYGGAGEIYQKVNLCLLRDLKDAPIKATAKASTFLGDVRIHQDVNLLHSEPGQSVSGYQRAKICAPVIGCLDAFTQKFKLSAVSSDLKSGGQKVGDYQIHSSHALRYDADGFAQGLKVNLPALEVNTPYGQFSASPEFKVGNVSGFVLAPYDGNTKSNLAGLNAHMTDLYGRNPGTKISQIPPFKGVFSDRVVDDSKLGWISQIAIGGRDADPKKVKWTPDPATEWPARNDHDLTIARSKEEKSPNAYMGASVKVAYSPTDMLPDWIRNSGFVSIAFAVYVQPSIDVGFTSQFNVSNSEVAELKPPYNDYRPMNLDQYKGVNIYSGVSAAARTALEAGVDLVLHLHVPLPWPLDDIDEDLIDIHPKTTVKEAITTGYGSGDRKAGAFSQASKIIATQQFFQAYETLSGPTDGAKHVQTCLARPTETGALPPEPSYSPGNPKDLLKGILYPCNICVGMADKTWKNEKGDVQTIKGFLSSYFPSTENTRPDAVKWKCDHVYETGCFDMCAYDPVTKKLSVVETAIEMLTKGKTTKMPRRCR